MKIDRCYARNLSYSTRNITSLWYPPTNSCHISQVSGINPGWEFQVRRRVIFRHIMYLDASSVLHMVYGGTKFNSASFLLNINHFISPLIFYFVRRWYDIHSRSFYFHSRHIHSIYFRETFSILALYETFGSPLFSSYIFYIWVVVIQTQVHKSQILRDRWHRSGPSHT